MLRKATGGRLVLSLVIAVGVFMLSREWATQLATLPIKPITKNSCPAEFFVIGERPGGQYALVAVFDYSKELKHYFYGHAKDREKTRRILQETWPTAEILWPDDTGVDLKIPETLMGDAVRLLNAEIAEVHVRLDLFPAVLEFQSITDEGPGSEARYRLVIDRGHIPEHYLYRVESDGIVPVAYVAENRLGGVFVSMLLGAVSSILVFFVASRKAAGAQ